MKIPFWPEFKGFRDIDLGLDRMYQALERLDNPHKKLPKVIHIAGTNGKGSTLAFLRSIFESANYKVHAYSSPHLVDFNERIYLAGKNIEDDFLNKCLQICKNACEQEPKISLTFFEGTTLAAFLAFSMVKADIVILETGMGGRLDATNVLDEVMASIITPIAIDHAEFLGDNISDIAFEKAGIIKPNSLVICGKQELEALEVVKSRSDVLGCDFLNFQNSYDFKKTHKNWIFNWSFENKNNLSGYLQPKQRELSLDYPKYLNQNHQLENLSNVIAFILAQNHFKFSFAEINHGICEAKWPARLEKITSGKFYKKLQNETAGKNSELVIDGGHNPHAGEIVNQFLASKNDKFRIVLFSMLEDKDYQSYLFKIKDNVDLFIACDIDNSVKAKSVDDICNFAKTTLHLNCIKSSLINSAIEEAIAFINKNNIENSQILVCGSLYLAGNFKEQNNNYD